MNDSHSGEISPTHPNGGRRPLRPNIHQATLILPRTGQRVRRVFTLQSPSPPQPSPDDGTGLLYGDYPWPSVSTPDDQDSLWARGKRIPPKLLSMILSPVGRAILKCSVAYMLGSLATFVPAIREFLGKSDGKHIVATVTVYFHPARSTGSMIQATLLAFIAFLYAALISFSSMAVSVWFGKNDLTVIGHSIVLILFCGGGLGFVAWLKQRMGNPLVNVACSLTSLAIITVLTKEGAVQAALFSYEKVFQVLKMILLGVTASTMVNLCINPSSARGELRKQLVMATDSLEDMLRTITRAFLSGEDEATMQSSFTAASTKFKRTFGKMTTTAQDAAYEHYLLGTVVEHKLMEKLVGCVEQLAQDLGGLRVATTTQFALLSQLNNPSGIKAPNMASPLLSPLQSPSPLLSPFRAGTMSYFSSVGELSSIDEETEPASQGTVPDLPTGPLGPPEIFSYFIGHLGPPMKALAFTMKEILGELPFQETAPYAIQLDQHFKDSLKDAMHLFEQARNSALERIYDNKGLSVASSTETAADLEEVAASCGYFSSSLLDFAEDLMLYLDAIEALQDHLALSGRRRRSWIWLLVPQLWQNLIRKLRGKKNKMPRDEEEQRPLLPEDGPEVEDHDDEDGEGEPWRSTTPPPRQPPPKPTLRGRLSKVSWRAMKLAIVRKTWQALRFLVREDVKFATKVGLGAILFAMWSFIPATRPIYAQFRGEWGLLSYMLVCSMTIGASNTTGFHRFLGTCTGAALAVLAWIVADENPFVLGVLGWLVCCGCFYIIIGRGQGPMGRFILLTYNLSALYAYSLAAMDQDEDDDDEGGISPEIWPIVFHRTVSVMLGCLWGILITRFFWPISARRKIVDGMALLWLRMGITWKRDPLNLLQPEGRVGRPTTTAAETFHMDIREVRQLKRYLAKLNALKASASQEFQLRGPFPEAAMARMLDGTERMLDAFYAMKVVITRDLRPSRGAVEVLRYTTAERAALSQRIGHLFSVLASSMKLQYPLSDTLPNLEHPRDRFLARLYRFWDRHSGPEGLKEEDFELFYAYALVTGQLGKEIRTVARELEGLYGTLDEDSLKLE